MPRLFCTTVFVFTSITLPETETTETITLDQHILNIQYLPLLPSKSLTENFALALVHIIK